MLKKSKDSTIVGRNGSNNGSDEDNLSQKISVQTLRANLKGQIIFPEDAEYDPARRLFYGGNDKRPGLIVRPVDAAEVAYIVNLARETGVELAVRSGGHSPAGHSVSNGGITLDLKNMKSLVIDETNQTAWAETGLTAEEYTTAAAKYGLGTGFGDTGSVGIGGITLGGGIGYLVRKHGLTIDSLLAAELVTANGEILHLDDHSHPDLFWAIRGGGGNFGVATRFQFKLYPVQNIFGGMLLLPATSDAIAAFIAEAEAAPEELSTIANIMPAPPMPFLPADYHGKIVIMAMLVYAGDIKDGERAVAPIRAITQPIADMLKPMTYPEIYPPEEYDYQPTAVGRTMFLEKIDRSDAQTIVHYLTDSDAPMRVAQIRVLGGAMARIPVDATAFAHRQARIMAGFYNFYTGPEDLPRRKEWVKDFTSAMDQGNSGEYVNFMANENELRVRNAYPGQTWERLKAIKARYDPSNLFRLNQNIPPQ